MTKELQEALTEILNGVLLTKDFVLSELPEVVTQLLAWKFYVHLIWFAVGIIGAVGTIILFRKFWKHLHEKDDDPIILMLPLSTGFISIIVIAESLDWLKIWIAPKIYLIEYAASLAK